MLSQVQSTLETVGTDLKRLSTQQDEQSATLLEAFENLSAHMVALEGIVAVLAKSQPVDFDTVRTWIKDRTGTPEGEYTDAEGIAEYLLTGKSETAGI